MFCGLPRAVVTLRSGTVEGGFDGMSDLVASTSLREFFKHVLSEAMRRQRVDLQDITEFYLVNLLAEFAHSQNLFSEVDGKAEAEPLALIYHRALQQGREERIRTLRRLG